MKRLKNGEIKMALMDKSNHHVVIGNQEYFEMGSEHTKQDKRVTLEVNDCIQRFSWADNDPMVTTVMTTCTDSCSSGGMRQETRGQGPTIKFPVSQLWENYGRCHHHLKLSNLSILPWQTEGKYRNKTQWLNSDNMEVKMSHFTENFLTKARWRSCILAISVSDSPSYP